MHDLGGDDHPDHDAGEHEPTARPRPASARSTRSCASFPATGSNRSPRPAPTTSSVDPILKSSEKPEPSGIAPAPGGEAGLNILIAEDNEINAMLARVALSKAGHHVRLVTNGRAAVDAVIHAQTGRRFDVVLMDLHMPVMDGLDAIALIRKHEEEHGAPPIPIMVLSADSQETTRHAVLAHGATGFVSKPLDPKALAEAVAEQAVA